MQANRQHIGTSVRPGTQQDQGHQDGLLTHQDARVSAVTPRLPRTISFTRCKNLKTTLAEILDIVLQRGEKKR